MQDNGNTTTPSELERLPTGFPRNQKIDAESALHTADVPSSLDLRQPVVQVQSQATIGRPLESSRIQPDTISKYLPQVEIVMDAHRSEFIEAMAATIRKATQRDNWIDTGTDEKAIFVTLRDLSEADRKSLETFYHNRYGISLSKELEREMSGADLARAKALLDRKDTSSGDAGYIHSLLVEANQLIVGRSKANIAQVVRDKLFTLSASDIEKLDIEYTQAYGKGLRSALYNDVRFNKGSQESFEILLKGTDKMTTFDHLRIANIALATYDAEMFQQAMTHASPEARRLFLKQNGEEKVRQAFAGHWYHSLTAGLSGNVTNTELRHAQDYLKDGRLSAASKLKDNTSWLGDNEKAIEDALVNISERERHSYQAARKALLDGKEPGPSDLPVYADLQKLFRSHGNKTEQAAWEAMIIYPGNALSKELLAHRGLITNSGIDRVTNSLEQINHNDFQLLKSDPRFQKDMEGLLASSY